MAKKQKFTQTTAHERSMNQDTSIIQTSKLMFMKTAQAERGNTHDMLIKKYDKYISLKGYPNVNFKIMNTDPHICQAIRPVTILLGFDCKGMMLSIGVNSSLGSGCLGYYLFL